MTYTAQDLLDVLEHIRDTGTKLKDVEIVVITDDTHETYDQGVMVDLPLVNGREFLHIRAMTS